MLLARDLSSEIETSISNRAYTARESKLCTVYSDAKMDRRSPTCDRQHGAPYSDIRTSRRSRKEWPRFDRYDRRERDARMARDLSTLSCVEDD